MRALTVTAPGHAEITEIPEPHPQEGELLLRVEVVGLCGTDLNSFRGRNPLIEYPRILGHEIGARVLVGNASIPAGTHVAVSPYTHCGACPSCRRGRENACLHNQTFGVQRDGAITELLAVPAAKVYPSTLPFHQLALVEPLTVGFHAVARGRITANDQVAVFGCGGIGLGAIAGAAFRRAQVIAIDLDDRKLEIARLAGATHLIHSGREDVAARLRELTHNDGPDVMIEAIGLPETFRLAVEAVAYTGRVVYIGYAKEPVAYQTRLFVQKELDILGSRNALPEDFLQVIAMLEAGSFPVDATITATVPLDHAPGKLAEWSANPAAFTKIMIDMQGER
jgi:threonine dehydrogenase-like Zn-dependent dehydrogenase